MNSNDLFGKRGINKYIVHFLSIVMYITMYSVHSINAMPRTEESLFSIKNKVHTTGVEYGSISSITEPKYVSVNIGDLYMEGRDPVFVMLIPGEQPRVYPQKIMVWHEVVNGSTDIIGYAVTYSPLSGSIAAYDTTLEGSINLIFDNEGSLYNSSSILIDRNTGSLWSQLLGMSYEGPLKGKGLKHIPLQWSTWDKVKKEYPNALVLTKPKGSKKVYGRDPYGSYITTGNYYDNKVIVYPVEHQDRSIHPKQRVIGIEIDGLPLAVNEAYVKEKKVVNFFFGPYSLVAVFDPKLDVVRVFERDVWDKHLLFDIDKAGVIKDIETGTFWDFNGKAVKGKLEGASLKEHIGIYSFWFSWYAFHPESIVVPGNTVVPESALIKNTLSVQ